jgi:hypothetical protein
LLVAVGSASTISNPSFETGNTSAVVSFNVFQYPAESAATDWFIWNNSHGTTATELCTKDTCPSGAGSPAAPVDGTYDIHVTSNGGPYNGIYQLFPEFVATTAGIYLNIVTGPVEFAATGPDGTFYNLFPSSGLATLNFASSRINEIYVFGIGNVDGVSNFYADAVTLDNVPEPTTLLLGLGGLLTVVGLARRRRSQS